MKNFFKFYVVFVLLLVGVFFIPQNVGAVAANNQTITLSPGWNIISTPKVLSSHIFSVDQTSTSFDIYLLDPTSPSGWQTMQGEGQTEFQPLFAYFINNKTGSTQTLTFNYNFDLTPAQRLFQRTLQPGWNAIGIASPNYALQQGSTSADINNPSNILSTISGSVSQVVDFTSGNTSLDSPAVSTNWLSKTISDINSLNDFRELKAYGVFVTSTTNNYNGSQNLSLATQYTLTYTAGSNGSITGTSPQTVTSGSDGTAVTAVATAGYHFVDWSDDSTSNPRTDTNVAANINVTANFTKTTNPSTLTVTADTSTPTSTSVNVNNTSGTTDVPMFVFDARSTVGASTITDLKFTVTGDAAAIAKVNAIKLYDGSTLLGSQSLSGLTASFSNLSITVAQDATKALTVKADFASNVTNSTGVIVSIATPSTDVTYQQPDLTSTNPTSSAVTGNEMYLFDGASAALSFISATSTYTYNTTSPSLSYTTGVITFRAHADGGTMTALTNSTVKAKWNTTILSSSNVNVDFAPVGGTDGANLSDGGDATVTVTMTVPRSTSGSGFINFNISEIDWSVGGASASQTWGLTDFKTPYANVQ